jgi:signal transduction histidine kinase
VAEGSTPDSSSFPCQPSGPLGAQRASEHFAALVERDRALILASYKQSLLESQSPLIGDPLTREQTLTNATEIIIDVTESVRANVVRVNKSYKRLAWTIGETWAVSKLNSTDSLRAAVILSNVTVSTLARYVSGDIDLLPSFVIAILALNESINRRIREATLAYNGYLLNRIHGAHLDERLLIARELHDWLGEGVSGALRQLELHELTEADRPAEPTPHIALAKTALVEAMAKLRLVLSGLRRDPVTKLEKALTDYITSAAPGVDVRLRVNGDESWASPMVIEEVFMIIREALRNAITHAAPHLVLVGVDVAPHELRARVEDDGRGFEPGSDRASGSAGLASMQERAALVGGSLTVASRPGQGTQVELFVPLPGPRDEEPG